MYVFRWKISLKKLCDFEIQKMLFLGANLKWAFHFSELWDVRRF